MPGGPPTSDWRGSAATSNSTGRSIRRGGGYHLYQTDASPDIPRLRDETRLRPFAAAGPAEPMPFTYRGGVAAGLAYVQVLGVASDGTRLRTDRPSPDRSTAARPTDTCIGQATCANMALAAVGSSPLPPASAPRCPAEKESSDATVRLPSTVPLEKDTTATGCSPASTSRS